MKVKVTNPPAATCMCGLTCSDRPSRRASLLQYDRQAPSAIGLGLVSSVCFAVALEPLYVGPNDGNATWSPARSCSVTGGRRSFDFTRLVREARDLPSYAGEAFKTFRIGPDPLQCSQRQQSWPTMTNHQAEQGLSSAGLLESEVSNRKCSFEHHLPLFWAWGGGMQQGAVGLSVFFSLLMFVLNREPEAASSRFDSGVSILVAAFVRPDGWIQGPLVLQWPSSPVLDASHIQVVYCTVLYRGDHYCARGAARIVI